MVVSALLEQQGFNVIEAISFASAREVIADDSCSFDVALLDQHLGDGQGLDLVPLIRAKAPSARVILVSADVEEDAEDESGVDHRVLKGGPFRQLLALINREVV